MKVGVLTGGGDCPGLNAAIRAVVYRATARGHTVVGFLDGWKGLQENDSRPLTRVDVQDIIGRGGTILGSSRTNPFKAEPTTKQVLATWEAHHLHALVAIGGDDTLSAALALSKLGKSVVGVPKTMDNDVNGTDWTFGFDSATSVAVDALARLKDTATSHHRALILEVMGRHAGWVALVAGVASGADYTVIPEETFDEARMLASVSRAIAERRNALIVVSEGANVAPHLKAGGAAKDDFGHEILKEKGVGAHLASLIEKKAGVECRSAVIGHIQRGGPPTLFDRILATRLGTKAADMVETGEFGRVAVLRGDRIEAVPLAEAVGSPKVVTAPWIDLLHTFDA